MMAADFPKGFLWGAATAAHQVEGSNHSDWTAWEHTNSARLATEAARRHANASTRIPDYILKQYPNPLQPENYISGQACDSYNRFREDFDIAKSLGHNAHRFSIEWSRIEPEEGKFNEKEIEHYREVILALRERRIDPFVTLWHWPLPLWVRDKKGWEGKDIIKHFLGYTEYAVRKLGDLVTFWITINEPDIYARSSYLHGVWPPQKKSLVSYIAVIRTLAAAHREAYETIHEINPAFQVGVAQNIIYFEGVPSGFKNWFRNHWFLNQIRNHQDFVGLNHYFHERLWRSGRDSAVEFSDMGWEIYPEGIYHVLMKLKRYRKPIFITENGVADARDVLREKFIKETLSWVLKAIREGVDVRGYLYWALLDNFEWDKGFWPKFGLAEVDYRTLERRIRPGALVYKKIAEANSLDV